MFLGGEKPNGKTVVILDVENGSVAAALVRLDKESQPKLFGQMRKTLPVPHSLSASTLAQLIVKAAREVLHHASTVAARIRTNQAVAPLGEVSRIEIFFSPPWTNLHETRWHHEESISAALRAVAEEHFGDIPHVHHPFGRTVASAAQALFPQEQGVLLSTLTGEVTELLLLKNGAIVGRATMPQGHHTLLRTLKSHAGMSDAEARSAFLVQSASVHEPLASAARHLTAGFKDAAQDLFTASGVERPNSVFVVAHEPVGEWFAQALGEESSLEELFPNGGTVRALRAHHLTPYLGVHARPDLFLMLGALYVDAHSSALRQ